MIDTIHVDVCPKCRTSASHHSEDPPPICPHEYELYLPELYVRLDDVASWLRRVDRMQDVPGARAGSMPAHNALWDAAGVLERTVVDKLRPEERAERSRG